MSRLLALLLFLPVPALADVVPSPRTKCPATDHVVPTAAPGARRGFQRLDRLPPAAEYLALYRTIGDCPAPVIVRFPAEAAGTPRH